MNQEVFDEYVAKGLKLQRKLVSFNSKITSFLKGREVILPSGKYQGRIGRIYCAWVSEEGCFAVVYVLRANNDEILNTDGDSRLAWDVRELEFI